jgi:hypothetical protein
MLEAFQFVAEQALSLAREQKSAQKKEHRENMTRKTRRYSDTERLTRDYSSKNRKMIFT